MVSSGLMTSADMVSRGIAEVGLFEDGDRREWRHLTQHLSPRFVGGALDKDSAISQYLFTAISQH